jgi:glycosyltransferase involved in cell wall biosynthesis
MGAFYFPHRWRLIVTLHGSDIAAVPVEQPKVKSWQRRLLRRADCVTAVSQPLLDQVLDLHPFLRDRSEVIPNGLTPEWFESAPEQPVKEAKRYVLYVGRFDRVKGVDLLLRAWSQLADQAPGELWLAGDGPEWKALQDLTVSLKIAETVRFLGRVQREKLRALYRNSEFVVLPSRREGLSWVTLEAGACGAICVATRVGGSGEVIEHEKTGYLVDAESPDALACGMRCALELRGPALERMKHAARQKIRNQFSVARMWDRYEQVYCSLAGPSHSQKVHNPVRV